jgi:hypothetical protein
VPHPKPDGYLSKGLASNQATGARHPLEIACRFVAGKPRPLMGHQYWCRRQASRKYAHKKDGTAAICDRAILRFQRRSKRERRFHSTQLGVTGGI